MSLTRRQFLRTSGLIVLGAGLAACGDDDGSVAPTEGTIDEIIGGRSQSLQYIPVGTELLSGRDERLALGLLREGTLLTGATGSLWVAKDRTSPAEGPFSIEFHGDGLPEDRGFYESSVVFPSDGQWLVLVEAETGGEALLAAGTVQVGARNAMPKTGDDAISTPTPTTKDARGVDPICTAVPPCGMHGRSLDEALEAGEKVMMIIATPAYCTSRLCGPEVELLDDMQQEGITFIHVEVLANDDPQTVRTFNPLAPAAAAWKLEEEPALYSIADGVITERILGPADKETFAAAISRLAAL